MDVIENPLSLENIETIVKIYHLRTPVQFSEVIKTLDTDIRNLVFSGSTDNERIASLTRKKLMMEVRQSQWNMFISYAVKVEEGIDENLKDVLINVYDMINGFNRWITTESGTNGQG